MSDGQNSPPEHLVLTCDSNSLERYSSPCNTARCYRQTHSCTGKNRSYSASSQNRGGCDKSENSKPKKFKSNHSLKKIPIYPSIYTLPKVLLKTRKAKLITCIARTNLSLGLIIEESCMYECKSLLFMSQQLL